MSQFRHRPTRCPGCNYKLNASYDPQGRGIARGGDLTICSRCGMILRFDGRLRLTVVSAEDLEQLPQSTLAELKEMQDRFRSQKDRRIIVS